MKYPPLGIGQDVVDYLNTFQDGDRVIEREPSSCMYLRQGDVYTAEHQGRPCKCIRWDAQAGETGRMGTSVTWGARKINDTSE